jgi:hypothetical protein
MAKESTLAILAIGAAVVYMLAKGGGCGCGCPDCDEDVVDIDFQRVPQDDIAEWNRRYSAVKIGRPMPIN